jgi:glucan 1,3-beta-glucosidase
MGLYQHIRNSKNINLYSSGFWNFVSGYARTMCSNDCQENAVLYESNANMYVYGLSGINSENLLLERGVGSTNKTVAMGLRSDNQAQPHDGFKVSVIAAYLRQT